MKFLTKLSFILLLMVSACSKPTENVTSIKPDSLNQILYKKVMDVHDDALPNMEKVYKLKQDFEEQIANTPNLSKKQEKSLEQVITSLDSAGGSMRAWMQNFNPLPDSADVLQARTYLESELERVTLISNIISDRVAMAEAKLQNDVVSKDKKTITKSTTTKDSKPTVQETTPAVTKVDPKPEPVKNEPIVYEPIPRAAPKDSIVSKPVASNDSSAAKKHVVKPVEKVPEGKPFYFKLVNAESGTPVSGEVHVMEAKATQYQAFIGNELIYLQAPKNIGGMYQIDISAPGYKPAKLIFNYHDTEPISSGTGDKHETIVTFELVRAKRGDYIDFNEVRFFRSTTILEPQSRTELNGLVSLMKEGAYKVKIHGHCNGAEARNVTTLGTSTNIFALEPSHNKRQMMTAEQMTEIRAEVVKNYLVSQGIEADRILTKGQGGKMMMYPRNSTLANRNDRVEVEVLKSK